MDDILASLDRNYLTPHVYPATWAEESISRQVLTLSVLSVIGSYFVYFIPALFSYYAYFDKRLMKHKKFKRNQVRDEIICACKAVPVMGLLTVPFFILEVRGYTQLYESMYDVSPQTVILQLLGFMMWNDCLVYFVHRALHLPYIYKHIHKTHHKWIIPTPFASHAFHPLDGWSQSVPYHMYILFFPMPKWVFFVSFSVLNVWTTSIHDELFLVPDVLYLREMINGAAHHTDHHVYFNYNHGLYFTFWDRLCGTYKKPSSYVGDGPYQDLGIKIH